MRNSNRWWMICMLAALLVVSGCTDNSLDESEADVILKVLGISDPVVEAELGECQNDSSIQCGVDGDCPLDNLNNPTGPCILSPEPCTISEWSISMANEALNSSGSVSPFNDVVVDSVVISYDWESGVPVTPDRTVILGQVIEAGASGSVSFFPITFGDLVEDNTTVGLTFQFKAFTISGHNPVMVFGGQGNDLFIENGCVGL